MNGIQEGRKGPNTSPVYSPIPGREHHKEVEGDRSGGFEDLRTVSKVLVLEVGKKGVFFNHKVNFFFFNHKIISDHFPVHL